MLQEWGHISYMVWFIKIGQSLSTLHVSSEVFHHQQAFIKIGQPLSTLHVSSEAFHHQQLDFIKIGQ